MALFGLKDTQTAVLAYLLGFISGIIVLLLEKESSFVKFHAMQSTITFLALVILSIIAGYVPIVGGILGNILSLIGLIFWIVGMVKAYRGERYKFPIIGDIAQKQI
uniref:Chloroplast import component protein (Tic20) n=1 Tax=Methanococcus maripaludis (strain C6 / ATCC BAA-1332) TaxID=444158 RepID=A9A9C0_METM6